MAQSITDVINEKVIPPILAFVNTRPVQALKNGMMVVMPLTIVGAIFLLIANFPIDAFQTWEKEVGLYAVLMAVYAATFNLLGIVACLAITYNYVKDAGYEGLPAAVWAMCTMVLLMPTTVTDTKSGASVAEVIPMAWTGSKGMVGGIIIAFLVSIVYIWFLRRNITIKMPDGVPPNVATAFVSLIPGTVILTAAAIVFAIFRAFDTTMVEAIYAAIQTPLQGMTDSIGGVMAMSLIGPFLWFFGVHGSSIVSGVMTPMLQANMVDNQRILDSGQELTLANGGHIVTQQFLDNFIIMTGSGVTIGAVIYMLFFAKSAQFKTLGRLGGAPAVFNINEPIIFGTPIVMNPILAAPFILVPFLLGMFQYFCLYTGIVPLYTGVLAPWTTPPIISGLLIGGWRTALMQLVGLLIAVAVYFPFMKKADNMAYAEELALAAESVETTADGSDITTGDLNAEHEIRATEVPEVLDAVEKGDVR